MSELSREQIEKEIREQMRAAMREYKREWRKKNPDKVKAANERYWIKRAMKMRAEQEAKNELD